MECSICYSEITSATGKVELSCSHPFHFSCLTSWFDKQKTNGSCENCPLCRHEANEFEKMPASAHDEEESDDETWEYEDDEPTIDELAAQERARLRFARYKLLNPEKEVQLYAANLIKACWRGYQDRLVYRDLLDNKDQVEGHENCISNVQKQLKDALDRAKFLKRLVGMTRTQAKSFAAAKIQSIWRRHVVKQQIHSVGGIWRKTAAGRWEKIVFNPEEHEPATVTMQPLVAIKLLNPEEAAQLEEKAQLYSAKLIQACWRGYRGRLLYQDLLHTTRIAV